MDPKRSPQIAVAGLVEEIRANAAEPRPKNRA
jgi:hypothetical protein